MAGLALQRQQVRRLQFDNRQLAEEAGRRTVSQMGSGVERLPGLLVERWLRGRLPEIVVGASDPTGLAGRARGACRTVRERADGTWTNAKAVLPAAPLRDVPGRGTVRTS